MQAWTARVVGRKRRPIWDVLPAHFSSFWGSLLPGNGVKLHGASLRRVLRVAVDRQRLACEPLLRTSEAIALPACGAATGGA